ncbi:hypothetical protein DL95DRAFT_384710 [Leptodontidium sp. 2 PMI_412]|nr:hypothetical protein DL95DRAFT_384710 [Leptodontidium sp. 2 PMI_412]
MRRPNTRERVRVCLCEAVKRPAPAVRLISSHLIISPRPRLPRKEFLGRTDMGRLEWELELELDLDCMLRLVSQALLCSVLCDWWLYEGI